MSFCKNNFLRKIIRGIGVFLKYVMGVLVENLSFA